MFKVILFLILMLPEIIAAQPDNTLQQIKLHSQKINTIEADFTQTKTISFIDEQLVSSGKFWFSRPNKMRWEYQNPFFYSIIINGDNIKVIDDKKVSRFNAASNAMFGQIKLIIMNMVNGKMFDDPAYHATLTQNADYIIVNFETVNKGMKEYISSIDLYFNAQNYEMEKIKMNEASGDVTVIKFKNQKFNNSIKDDIFKL